MLILSSPLTKICEGCGKEYTPDKQQAKRQKFCTTKCREKTQRLIYEENNRIKKMKDGKVEEVKNETHKHTDLYYGIEDGMKIHVCEECGRIRKENIINKGPVI